MARTKLRLPAPAFTLIELLVAICVSVVLLVILAFVFKVSAGATRDATSRVGMTERIRLLNIRMRQEIGSMLPIPRLDPGSGNPLKPYKDMRTFDVAGGSDSNGAGSWIMFATSTVENGLPVNVDVRYQWIQDPGGDPHKNVLVRWRDHTGPYSYDPSTHLVDLSKANSAYLLGDNSFETAEGFRAPPTGGDRFFDSDVLMQNVRSVKFAVSWMDGASNRKITTDVPASMPVDDDSAPLATAPNPTDLYPRQLPAGVRLDLEYGPEQGDLDRTETVSLFFTVYRGL